jgi:ribosomal protein L11 methyltransferase
VTAPGAWQQLHLCVAGADVARAEALLTLAGALAVSLDDADTGDGTPVLEPPPGETPLWPSVALTALFETNANLAPLIRALENVALPGTRPRAAPLDAAAILAGARRAPQARAIGKRLWLAPRGIACPEPGRLCVELDMGLAFGTGEHATTALCLEWLEAELPAGAAVLDYGCGSGVLAVAALVLGARCAWAVDNDPQALTATRDNARLNGVADTRLVVTAPEALGRVTPDVIVANIVADPLVALAPLFAELLRDGGRIVLSGVLEAQAERVVAAYARHFERFDRRARDGWLRITAERSSAAPPLSS